MAAAGPAPRTGVRVSAGLYIGLIAGGMVLAGALAGWAATDSKVTELMAAAPLPFLISLIAGCVLLYKGWKAIDDGQARTTPGKAVGFMFIPIFSYYWIFNVTFGWVTDYNKYIQRYGIQTQPLSQGLWWATLACLFLFPIATPFLLFYIIAVCCKAINALPA